MPPTDGSPPGHDPSPSDERFWASVDRYLTGDAEPHEAEAVRAWLAADPTSAEALDDIRRIREVVASRPRLRTTADVWAALVPELKANAAQPAQPAGPRRALPVWRGTLGQREVDAWPHRLTAAVAVFLVAAFVTYGWWGGWLPGAARTGSPTGASEPARVFSTTRGQRAEIRLVDGTRVVLAAESRLTLPADYDAAQRAVRLEGEAYFDVQHDVGKPFSVGAGHAVVHDLGTRFDVRAYPSDSDVLVVVAQGSVRMVGRAATDSVGRVLERGAAARMDSAGQLSVAMDVDITRYLSWTHGRLAFAATPLSDVAAEVGRWYDVDIVIADSALAARRLTATIEDQPLSQVLDQLSVALDIRAVRAGRRVTLTPLSNRTRRP